MYQKLYIRMPHESNIMGCGDYSNHCNKAGYYMDYVPNNSYQNSVCYSWANTNQCGTSYHVDNSPCYKNVAYSNVTRNVNWNNNHGSTPETHSCGFSNSCAWGGNWCQFGNTCTWGGNFCNWGNSCTHKDVAAYGDNRCVPVSFWYDGGPSGTWYNGTCSYVYSAYYKHGNGTFHVNNLVPHDDVACYSGHSDSCYSSWGNSCYSGYPNNCASSWGNSCYTGYPNSCYYYSNHSNYPFSNFCNHSNTFI